MTQNTKQDIFCIEDRLDLSFEEIKERALDIADQRALENGWLKCQVFQVGNPSIKDGTKIYQFEMSLVQDEGSFSSEEAQEVVKSFASAGRVAISRDLDL